VQLHAVHADLPALDPAVPHSRNDCLPFTVIPRIDGCFLPNQLPNRNCIAPVRYRDERVARDAARVAGVDATTVRAGMPGVDGRVELHARIPAPPGGFGELAQQITRLKRLTSLSSRDEASVPGAVRQDRAHEVVS